jgi:hypothetical protein
VGLAFFVLNASGIIVPSSLALYISVGSVIGLGPFDSPRVQKLAAGVWAACADDVA